MRKLAIFTVIVCTLIAPAQAGEFFNFWGAPKPHYSERLIIQSPDGKTHEFMVELATTPQQHQTGMMNRKSVQDNEGMLFLFKDAAERTFWMKDTLVHLDMLFINEIGIVHNIHENAEPLDLTGVRSYGSSKAVLEIKGGTAQAKGIEKGSKVIYGEFGQ